MISVTNVEVRTDTLPVFAETDSVKDIEGRMTDEGDSLTQSLFTTAMLLLNETSDFQSLHDNKKPNILKVFLSRLVSDELVIATEDDGSTDIQGAGLYVTNLDDMVNGQKVARLDRMAVIPEQQRKRGYGSAILEHIETTVANQGMSSLWIAASLDAATFYFKRGYKMSGDPELLLAHRTLMLYKDLESRE